MADVVQADVVDAAAKLFKELLAEGRINFPSDAVNGRERLALAFACVLQAFIIRDCGMTRGPQRTPIDVEFVVSGAIAGLIFNASETLRRPSTNDKTKPERPDQAACRWMEAIAVQLAARLRNAASDLVDAVPIELVDGELRRERFDFREHISKAAR